MEFITLDSNFQPWRPVDNYSSLIWTERYFNAGDFQLVTHDIANTMALLPRESCVTLRESTVPMLVETHKIEKPKDGAPKLTVTGRSYEACALERRASVNSLPSGSGRSAWMMAADKESDAAYKAMRVVLGDQERLFMDGSVALGSVNPAVSPNDAMPQLDLVLPADYSAGVTNSYEIKAGELYNTILELLTTNQRGIKAVRPNRGNTKVAIEIYNGADLTGTDPNNVKVVDARFDQVDDATYLLSAYGSMNVGYIYGANGSQQVLKTAAPEPTGMDRRVLFVDVASDATSNTPDIRTNRGLIELYKYNATALFDGEVASQIANDYNKRYFLGDILKLVGEYGLSQNVRVAEFIRTSDNTGDAAYPTFEAITS